MRSVDRFEYSLLCAPRLGGVSSIALDLVVVWSFVMKYTLMR
jgi:hypothetical protein